MKKFIGLLAILLVVLLLPLASSAADHIVFIHGWQGSRNTWANMVELLTTGVPAYIQESNVLCVDYSNRSGDWPIKILAADVSNQIRARFGSNLPKMDFVVHSMGGLVLRAMVAEGYLPETLIGRVVTLGTPHFGQKFQFSQQNRDIGFASPYVWELAHARTKISKNKILCVVGTRDGIVDQWSAALDNPYECTAVRYVPKDHTSAGDYIWGDALCECGDGRRDVVYRLVTDFLSSGTIAVGSTSGTDNLGAILYQVVDGRDNPIAYNLNANWQSQGIAAKVKKADESATSYYDFSTTESVNKGIAEVVYGLPDTRGVAPGNYVLDIPESRDKSFAAFTTEPITVRRGRTTVVQIHAENVKPLDFLFLIDSTGSMNDDIASVKASARQLIQQKLGDGARNCRVAIADYRDYPESPYGTTGDYVFKLRCNFTTNATTAISALNAIDLGDGLDQEESVLSALYLSITRLSWNPDAAKTIMLMGDAGPHDPEPWSGGHSSSEVLALAKDRGVSIYPMLTGSNSGLAYTYESYATETGGKIVSSASYASAAEAVQEVIEQSIAANGFETETVNVTETAGSVTIRIYGGNSSASASIAYRIVSGSAINGTDYSAPSTVQHLSWSAGEKCYKTISIPVMQDASSSADKFFSIILSDPVNMGLGGINVCRVNILDVNSTGTPTANRVYVQALSRQSEGGSVSGSGSYILGSTITLRATAASGYVFTSWEDGSTSPVRTISSVDAKASAIGGVVTYVASFMKQSDLPLPEITSTDGMSGKVGEALNWCLDYYSPSEVTVTCSGLPSGFTFANGVVSGTATSPGSWTATFTVTNAKGSTSKSVTFTFEANPVFAGKDGAVSGFLPNGATEVSIPNGVTAVGEGAFSGCTTITFVKVPPTVTSIGKNAFNGCSGLTVVSLPRTLEGHLDASVFAGCSGTLEIQYYDVATVTFDPRGGDLDNPVRLFEVGQPFGELPELHENRWKFLGWSVSGGSGEFISTDTIVSGDTTCFAMWEADYESIDLGFYDVPDWEQPVFLSMTTNGLEHTTTFEVGDPIYMRYAIMNVAGFAAVNNFVVRFTLNSDTYCDSEWGMLNEGKWGWSGMNWRPDMLQDLPVGTYTLTCVLDAENFVSETDEGNNEVSITFEVVPSTKPDLAIDAATVSKANITVSESAIVHWRVANNGVSAAKKTQTAFQIWKYDASADDWILKKTEWVACNPLAAGAGRECTRAFAGKTFGVGDYLIRVWADGKDAIYEKNEEDNYDVTYTITVSKDNATQSKSSVDWQFKKLKGEPDSFYLSTSAKAKKKATTFKVGQTIYMRCCWWNALKKAVSGNMRVTVLLNGGAGIYNKESYLAKGYWRYFTDRTPDFLQNLPAGKYTLTAVLDSENNWTETNEKNNIRRISFTVVDAPTIYGEATFTCALNESVSWPISSEGSMSVKGLPPGMKYSGGAIVGKATKTGTFSAKFTAKNAAGTRTKTVKIVVVNPGFDVSVNVRANGATGAVSVAAGETVPMYVGVVQNIAVDSTPGKSGIAKSGASSVKVTGLPPGLKYTKGVISGVPSKAGTYTVKLTFKNALGWSKTFTMKMKVTTLPAFARGTFNGWSYESDYYKRKVTVSVTTAGKITAKVGTLSFSRTGWTVDGDGRYRANILATRTVGKGKSAKKYTDVLSLTLDPGKGWTEDQLTGNVATFNGNVALADALVALDGGESALVPSNADIYVSARRNSFGDNAEAKALAAELAALGTQKWTDTEGLVWNLKVSTGGVATIARTTGSGKNKKTISATAVVVWNGGEYIPYAVFLVDGKIEEVRWLPLP